MSSPEVQRLSAALAEGRDPEREVVDVFRRAQTLDRAGKGALSSGLDGVLRAHPPEATERVALLAGALVESGGAPEDFPAAVFDRLAEMLEGLGGDEEASLPECFYRFEQAAMACLSRSATLRRALPQKSRMRAAIRRYSERYGFLGKMLSVLDDEPLVVVHAPTGRAWRFRIGGIADNFQLHALLLGALAGEGDERIEGEVPHPSLVAEARDAPMSGSSMGSGWQLANGFALRADGTIDGDDMDRNWIWNEGVPEDIAVCDGVRVVLIGPTFIHRSWNAGRVFDGMIGRLDLERRLTDDESRAVVRGLLALRN